jgi:pimeloyl-ACP methyl ester carboxylesterase
MPNFTSDQINLFYDDLGEGSPLLFLHEFGGDTRSWKQQVAHFSSTHRCLALACRGYPPSDVPMHAQDYGWQKNIDDAIALLDHLCIPSTKVIGLSMGAYTGLQMCMQYPDRVQSLVAASGGSGAFPETRNEFIKSSLKIADEACFLPHMPADALAYGSARIQLREKHRAAWDEFYDNLSQHPGIGSGMTQRMVQAARPSLYDFESQLAAIDKPVLLMVGDEDDACLDTNLWLKRVMPLSGLSVWPKSGHLLNLEEPERFYAECDAFFSAIASAKWPNRQHLLRAHPQPV